MTLYQYMEYIISFLFSLKMKIKKEEHFFNLLT